jgi:hemerythrin-like metal-binding protein
MWKDAYAVGHELIDEQHRELFRMTDDLMTAIRRKDAEASKACENAVCFLKDYVVRHFADEEELQAALGYEGLAAHKKLHADFVATVLDYEKLLIESKFDAKVMQQFAGKLVGWLIYHVVGEDRKITGMVSATEPQTARELDPSLMTEWFVDSACEVLGQMLSIPFSPVNEATPSAAKNDISVSVGITGDIPGAAEFVFPLVTALRIVQSMTMVEPEDFDDMVESALREIANIVCGNAASKVSETGRACDITPPKLYRGQRPVLIGGKVVKCDLGSITVYLDETRKPVAAAG